MKVLCAAAVLLVLGAACGARPGAVLGQSAGGCAEALRERAAAMAAVDTAEKQAAQRNPGRVTELQAAAAQGKGAVMATADLGPCDRPASASAGVVVDVADLRQRYRVVIDQTTARINDIASRPLRGNDKKGSGGGTKGD